MYRFLQLHLRPCRCAYVSAGKSLVTASRSWLATCRLPEMKSSPACCLTAAGVRPIKRAHTNENIAYARSVVVISPVLPTYAREDVAFVRGEGPYLFDENGDRYLDFAAGIAVNALGHAHPTLVAALTEQVGKLWHTSNLYRIPEQERLATRLVDASFADTVFFTNSGVEAIECAIKMARRYHYAEGSGARFRTITFEGAFHGRTLAAIAAGGQPKYLEGFGPKIDVFDQVVFGDLRAVEATISPATAAILIEPVQGEGGLRPAEPEFLRGLRRLCNE